MFLVSTNLLHDSMDKDCVHFSQVDYMYVFFLIPESIPIILSNSFVSMLCSIDLKHN
jgi:hypothetical protein